MLINWNGKVFGQEELLFATSNRCFRYGDGLFETIRQHFGQIPLLTAHIDRLCKGMITLQMNVPEYFTANFFYKEIKKITKYPHQRVRLMVYRRDGGLYTPQTNEVSFCIEASNLSEENFILNEMGLSIGIYQAIPLLFHQLSAIKTCNSLPYIQASIFRQQHQFDDCLMLNTQGNITEATAANVFLLTTNSLITPPITEGCIEGIMRNHLITLAHQANIEVKESMVTWQTLNDCQGIILTNSIQGIRWVRKVTTSTTTYHYDKIALVDKLQELITKDLLEHLE